ncbi:conjugative transfer ATPase [Salmonella enterica]|nr:conjugative transfer ATPase [Salmonella enterica]EAA9597761.1 conjugative transfer ATPase [Salmonella enterica]EAO9640031.1 conjugative transfer ATPase [Salmonella enterica]
MVSFSLFNKNRLKSSFPREPVESDESEFAIHGREPLKRPGSMSHADESRLYETHPSIIDYLPWAEYLSREQCLLLDDGQSVGAVYSITPVASEGRTAARLEEIRDTVEDALQDSLEEFDTCPWVVQFFCQDETDFSAYMDRVAGYIKPHAQGTPFTKAWLAETEQHLINITRPEGLFTDSLVTGVPWRGQNRSVRMVVYRYLPGNYKEDSPVAALNQICERLTSSLAAAGVLSVRQNGEQIHRWLLRHFNPDPDWIDKDTLYKEARYCDDAPDALPLNNDFTETLWFNPPRSDTRNGVWWFDNVAHRAVPVETLRRPPGPGHLTGEVKRGDNINTLMDLLPEGTMVSLTIVAQAQDTLEAGFDTLGKNAIGQNTESRRTRSDVEQVKSLLGMRHKLYRASMTFLMRAPDVNELNKKIQQLTATLLTAGLQPTKPEYEVAPLNAYLRALPMCFNPQMDKKNWYTRLTWVQHLAGLLPVTGRSRGTGNPGFSFFNRGGEILSFDPLNSLDRTQNAHLLLFGPTGAGKSATLCSSLSQLMAVHRPRLFIAEAGNSFGLLAEYYRRLGLSVNILSIKPGCGISLPMFADAHSLMRVDPNKKVVSEELLPELEPVDTDNADDENEERDEERDILGEMEIAARMMITGGEKKEEERLTRADRGLIREAILMAAEKTYQDGHQMLAEDLQAALWNISRDNSLGANGEPMRNQSRRDRAAEMAEAMAMFTQGFEGELFNRPGTPWPEADVTLIDLGHLAREGYNAQMALAMVSLINTINNIAERDQGTDRDIVAVFDEAHISTTNPLLSPYMTKVVKMWRKLGAWLWMATQNLEDFPDIAQKMLNMAEWWLCLVMPPDEVEQIARFKTLSEEQKAILRSASKLSRCYTEGVVLSEQVEALFRVVPPSLYLALGMTEKEEKAERQRLMREYQCSELDAAIRVARKMDEARGFRPPKAA